MRNYNRDQYDMYKMDHDYFYSVDYKVKNFLKRSDKIMDYYNNDLCSQQNINRR